MREGTETNAVSTNDKKVLGSSAHGLAALRDVDELGASDNDDDEDDDYKDEMADMKEDYEF